MIWINKFWCIHFLNSTCDITGYILHTNIEIYCFTYILMRLVSLKIPPSLPKLSILYSQCFFCCCFIFCFLFKFWNVFWELFWLITCRHVKHFLLPLLSSEINDLSGWISYFGTKDKICRGPSLRVRQLENMVPFPVALPKILNMIIQLSLEVLFTHLKCYLILLFIYKSIYLSLFISIIYLSISVGHLSIYPFISVGYSPVSRGLRILQLHLCKGVKPLQW